MNVAEYEAMYRVEDTLWWYVGMRHIAERILDGRLGVASRPLRLLDAGCGTGGNVRWLERFGTTFGIDLSPHAIQFCTERGLRRIACASVLALPFPADTFDLVTSFDVIYHLDVRDDVAALAEMRRVLRPGGYLLVRVPALEQLRSEHDAAVHTRQRYTLGELRRKASAAGLAVERASYANTFLFPLAAAARLARSAGKKGKVGWERSDGSPVSPGRRRRTKDEGRTGCERSDVHPVHPWINALFLAVMRAEAGVVGRWDLPVGLSALVLARKPEGAGECGPGAGRIEPAHGSREGEQAA